MIAGPATNAATITTLWKVLGWRTAAPYLVTVAVSALGAGLLLDWLMPRAVAAMPHLAPQVAGHEHVAWWSHALAVLLVVLLVLARSRRFGAKGRADVKESAGTRGRADLKELADLKERTHR